MVKCAVLSRVERAAQVKDFIDLEMIEDNDHCNEAFEPNDDFIVTFKDNIVIMFCCRFL